MRIAAGVLTDTDRIVGVADFKVSADIEERLVTYALGSCLGRFRV